jgi:hydroxyacyl-ACP dehydratase HTD2-like protein with hotdog domain
MGVITDEARSWATAPFPAFEMVISRTDIQRFARAIGETDPVYFDIVAAREAGYPDLLAPLYFPYIIRSHASHLVSANQLEPDGSASVDVPPLPTDRAMAGETVIDFGAAIHAGDVITMEKRITDLYEKEGRSGTLVFVTIEFLFTNNRGHQVFRESFTRIYR